MELDRGTEKMIQEILFKQIQDRRKDPEFMKRLGELVKEVENGEGGRSDSKERPS